MARKREKKPTEYKDTFEFKLFPNYTYTPAQRLRLRLFQGRVEHWRAAINYADSFHHPNEINLLYMIGYHPSMKTYVDTKTTSNLVVLVAKVPQECLQIYDAFYAWVKKEQAVGYVDENGNPAPFYTKQRAKEVYRGTDVLPACIFEQYDWEDALRADYQRAKEEIERCFARYTWIDRRGPERTVSFGDLDKIIKQYFPYGREQYMGEKAYNQLFKKNNLALEAGLRRSDAAKVLDLTPGTDCYAVCRQSIRRCQMNVSVAIRERGYVDLIAMVEKMKLPPYGFGNDPYAAYCLGYALSGYLSDDDWIWDEITCFPAAKSLQWALSAILKGMVGRRKSLVLVCETGWKLSERFAYLFDIGTDGFTPRDGLDRRILELHRAGMSERGIAKELGTISNIAVHKRLVKMASTPAKRVPFVEMAHTVCSKIEKMTRWPVSLLDERLRWALCGDSNRDDLNPGSIPIFGKSRVNEAMSYFTVDHCKKLKKRIAQVETLIPDLIRERYGYDVDIDGVKQHCTTQSSGWLWEREAFWGCVDKYLGKK